MKNYINAILTISLIISCQGNTERKNYRTNTYHTMIRASKALNIFSLYHELEKNPNKANPLEKINPEVIVGEIQKTENTAEQNWEIIKYIVYHRIVIRKKEKEGYVLLQTAIKNLCISMEDLIEFRGLGYDERTCTLEDVKEHFSYYFEE